MLEGFKILRSVGQSLWMDHVTRDLLQNGSLMKCIGAGSVTGVLITPQSVCHSLYHSQIYDTDLLRYLKEGLYGETLAYELVFEDVCFAADQLRHVYDQTNGVNGWAVLPVSPLLTENNKKIFPDKISALHNRVRRPNTLITVHGNAGGLEAIEDIIFAGIPINIASIYTVGQFEDATEAYICGIERRIAAGLSPDVSVFVTIAISELAAAYSEILNRDKAFRKTISTAVDFYSMMRKLHSTQRLERAYNVGASPLRIVWLGPEENCLTDAEDMLFNHLVAPFTIAALSELEMDKYQNSKPQFSLLSEKKNNNESQSTGTSFDIVAKKLLDEEEGKKINAWIKLLEAVAKKSADLV